MDIDESKHSVAAWLQNQDEREDEDDNSSDTDGRATKKMKICESKPLADETLAEKFTTSEQADAWHEGVYSRPEFSKQVHLYQLLWDTTTKDGEESDIKWDETAEIFRMKNGQVAQEFFAYLKSQVGEKLERISRLRDNGADQSLIDELTTDTVFPRPAFLPLTEPAEDSDSSSIADSDSDSSDDSTMEDSSQDLDAPNVLNLEALGELGKDADADEYKVALATLHNRIMDMHKRNPALAIKVCEAMTDFLARIHHEYRGKDLPPNFKIVCYADGKEL